jgi:hypothetical protein
MNWNKIAANILALGSLEGAILAFVPSKYKEVVHLGVLFLVAMVNLFQTPPHKAKDPS